MGVIVLDTDLVSFLFKGDSRAAAYLPYLEERTWAVSFMTVAELDRWTIQRQWGSRRISELKAFLADFAVAYSNCDLCRNGQ